MISCNNSLILFHHIVRGCTVTCTCLHFYPTVFCHTGNLLTIFILSNSFSSAKYVKLWCVQMTACYSFLLSKDQSNVGQSNDLYVFLTRYYLGGSELALLRRRLWVVSMTLTTWLVLPNSWDHLSENPDKKRIVKKQTCIK